MEVEVRRKELDSSILEGLKINIYNYFNRKSYMNHSYPEILLQRMDEKKKLIVENLVEQNIGRMVNRVGTTDIAIDEQFCEKDANGKIRFKQNLEKIIKSQIIHELMHSASRTDIAGIREKCDVNENIDEISSLLELNRYFKSKHSNKKYSFKRKTGLDEGITQMMAEKVVGYTISPEIDSYKDLKKYAKILENTFGEEIMFNSYFFKTGELEEACQTLTQNHNFWDVFNNILDNEFQIICDSRNPNLNEHSRQTYKWFSDTMQKDIMRYFTANIIIPKLKNSSREEQKQYLEDILNSVKDDEKFKFEIFKQIQELYKKDKKGLEEEKNIALSNIRAYSDVMLGYTKCILDDEECSRLLVSDFDHLSIRPNKNSKTSYKIPNNSLLEEELLARKKEVNEKNLMYNHLKFDYPELSDFEIWNVINKKYNDLLEQKIERILAGREINFGDDDIMEKKSKLATIKIALLNKGYIVSNKLSECENTDNLKLDISRRRNDLTDKFGQGLNTAEDQIFEEYN